MRRHRSTRRIKIEQLELRQLLASDILFADPTTYGTGSEPPDLEVADFDGDGQLDLAVANTGSDSVSFLRGLPDGRFESLWPDVVVSGRPLALAAGDLDRDGNVDLVTANENGNRVAVIYGAGEGEFETPQWIDLSGLHESITLADLNEDDRLDILVTTNGFVAPSNATNLEPGVHAIMGRNLRSFEAPDHIYSSSWPVEVIASDLNGDRHLDIAVANDGFLAEDNVEVAYGAGDGTFGNAAVLKQGNNPQSVASADLNADGQMDVIVVNEATIGVLINQGNGVFAAEDSYDVNASSSPNPNSLIWGVGSQSVAASDLDADGDVDLAVSNFQSDSIYVLTNQGDGTLGSGGRFLAGAGTTAILSADFNGDRFPELSVVIGDADEVIVLQNTSTDLPTAVLLDGRGDRYAEAFDAALQSYDGPGARLPVGWSAITGGDQDQYVTKPFPPSSPMGIVSAGSEGDQDRALATGVSAGGEATEFVWTGRIDHADVESIHVNFDIEAWAGDPGNASDPGEASFNVTLEADTGNGFEVIRDFGRITTGQVLQPPPSAAGVELWKTDGNQVSFVADVVPGPESSDPQSFMTYNDELYFVAGGDVGDRRIYKINDAGVFEVAKLPCGDERESCSNSVRSWVLSNGLYFDLLRSSDRSIMLARIDSSGTVTMIPNTEGFDRFRGDGVVYRDEIYLVPEINPDVSLVGRELWKFNGQETVLVENINPRTDGLFPGASSDPRNFVEMRGELYFTAGPRHENEREIWRTDGESVELLTDIYPGTPSSVRSDVGASQLTVIDDVIYFIGDDDTGREGDRELWKFDGTEAVRIADIRPGIEGSFGGFGSRRGAGFTGFEGEVYFVADDGQTGAELWKTDGETVTRVTDLNPARLARPIGRQVLPEIYRPMIVYNEELYFAARDSGGFGLWKTDGETISEFANLNPDGDFLLSGRTASQPHFTIFDNELYFLADDGQTGVEIWKTDGTDVVRVTDINASPGNSFRLSGQSSLFTEYQGEVYFAADNGDGTSVIMDGNMPANRFEFDSGPIPASIPQGATIRLRFSTEDVGTNAGYVYGLDNFAFEILRANENDIPGDANRDGTFNSADLVQVFQFGEYEDGIVGNSTWEDGDWNGDGEFDSGDLVAAFQAGHYVSAASPFAWSIQSLFDLEDSKPRKAKPSRESSVDAAFDQQSELLEDIDDAFVA